MELYGITKEDKLPTLRFMDKEKKKFMYNGNLQDLTYEKMD